MLAWAADKRSQSSISPGDDDSLETRLSISEPELCARLPSEDLSRVSRRVSGSHDVPDDVAGWVQRAAAALSAQPGPRGGRLVVVGRLARRRYREGLEEHWAARAALCVARCCLLALPAAQLLLQVDVDRHQVAHPSMQRRRAFDTDVHERFSVAHIGDGGWEAWAGGRACRHFVVTGRVLPPRLCAVVDTSWWHCAIFHTCGAGEH